MDYNQFIFIVGLATLVLFAWYFTTEIPLRKRIIGSILAVLLVALCLDAINPPQKKIGLGLDLKGGSEFLIQLFPDPDVADAAAREISVGDVEQAVEVIRGRVDKLGVAEPNIVPTGNDRILVQLPGLDEKRMKEAEEQVQKVAKLEFRLVHPESEAKLAAIKAGTDFLPAGYEALKYTEKNELGKVISDEILVRKRAELDGKHVENAFARFTPEGWEIALNFNGEGADLFYNITKANVGQRLAILLDGKVESAPRINEAIAGGSAQITGDFTDQEAVNLASVLENPLGTPVKIIEKRVVSPTLGADSITSGWVAGLIGLAVTLVFVALYYQFAGIVANIALIINLILLMGALAMFGATLTLPGIAGIILTIGMAVDANVLIYERLREEIAAGKSLKSAVDAAYNKAFSAIFDSNVTTLITAVILFWQASGAVRGFAVTLMIGILASMFSALLVTRNLFSWGTELGWVKRIGMLNFIPKHHFDFIKMGRPALMFSLALIAACIGWFVWRGEKNFGVDFRGGDLLMLRADQMISEEQARKALGDEFGEVQIQMTRSAENEYLSIRSAFEKAKDIERRLIETFPEAGFRPGSVESVGPVVGSELMKKSLFALGLGLLAIMIYVTLRFEFSFALGALVAVLHDVIITIGIFSLLGREISLVFVGAILTIAGYSINDTIVVFDRIREGLLTVRKGSVSSVMNEAINQTLGRTILTGGTTFLAVIILLIFGGPVLGDFALAILIGVVVGTYSSIFVAAPVVLGWAKMRGKSIDEEVTAAGTQTLLKSA